MPPACALLAACWGRPEHTGAEHCAWARFASALAPKHANRALGALAKRHAARMARNLVPGPLSQAHLTKRFTLGGAALRPALADDKPLLRQAHPTSSL